MEKGPSVWCVSCILVLVALKAAAQPAPPPPQQPAGVPAPTTAIPLDQVAADRYEGYYQIGPQRAVRYWREGEHFYFSAVGTSQRAEVIPEASNRFSYANGAVTFTFNTGVQGKVTGMTVHQGGRDIEAPRIDEALAKSFPAPGAVAAAKPPIPRTWTMMTGAVPKEITARTPANIDYWPCFSPDGKSVLFSRTLDGGKTWALFRVPSVGGGAEPFAKLPVSATRASWSPKSGRIVFNGDATDGKGSGLWIIDGDGRNAHAIATEGVPAPSYPSWYPDGRTIGFGDASRNILYRMALDGGIPVAVTHQDQVLAGMSSVSPDGKWVAFAGQKNNRQLYDQNDNQLWLVDDSGVSKTLEVGELQGRTPSWSPNGKRLAFESDRGSPTGLYAIFIVDRDGSNLVQVTDYALNANHPVFSPDGHRLVFATGDPSKGVVTIAILTLT
jgi:dipeptidyl aminopeptidase/acylaminoacyl peptidase